MVDPTTPQDHDARQSTDRELWRERDDYYADSIHVTEGVGIGMNCGGCVYVMPLRQWHALARASDARLTDSELGKATGSAAKYSSQVIQTEQLGGGERGYQGETR